MIDALPRFHQLGGLILLLHTATLGEGSSAALAGGEINLHMVKPIGVQGRSLVAGNGLVGAGKGN